MTDTIQNSPVAEAILTEAGATSPAELTRTLVGLPPARPGFSKWFEKPETLSTVGLLRADTVNAGTAEGISVKGRIYAAVTAERRYAEATHGVQHLPLGTGSPEDKKAADEARATCDVATANGGVTWADVIREEVLEAFAEETPQAFIAEAVQAIGTLVAAIEDHVTRDPSLSLPPPF